MKRKMIAALGAVLFMSWVVPPISKAYAAETGGISVTSESGTETVLSSTVELTPLDTSKRIKVNDLLHYTYGDFINMETGNAKGTLDPEAKSGARQLSGTNWYQAPSISNILKRMYVKWAPTSTMDTSSSSYYGDAVEVVTEAMKIEEDDLVEEEVVEEPESVGYTPSTSTGSSNYSKTNVQVEGVDEADIIKTDGNYIYYLQPSKGIVIFDIQSGKPKQVAMLKPNAKIGEALPSYEDLYISGNNMIIVSNKTNVNIYEGVEANQANLPSSMYNYNYQNYGAVDIYDISNPANPTLTRQINVQGNGITTRLYNNTIYFVLDMSISGNYENSSLISIMPKYQDSSLGKEFYIMSPNDIYLSVYPDIAYYVNLKAVGALDLSDPTKPIQLAAYEFADSAMLYMNKSNLYLSSIVYPRTKYSTPITTGMTDVFAKEGTGSYYGNTMIARFGLKTGGYSFGKVTRVTGTLKDKYSIDEYNGTLRVLTSRYNAKYQQYLDLYTLSVQTLSPVGQLQGFSSGSSLSGVRFRGNTVYVTTSGTFNPLLIFDLSTPSSPQKLSSVDLKGFTDYLHPYKTNYLIGIGTQVENTYVKKEDSSDKHVGYRQGGVEFTLYDVADAKRPKLVSSLVIGGPNSTTIGMTNPKTVMFDEERGTMTMPFVYRDSEIVEEGKDPVSTTWQGGLVLKISDTGFKEGARIELGSYFANSSLSRFAYVDDMLYYVTADYLIAMDYNQYNIKYTLTIVY